MNFAKSVARSIAVAVSSAALVTSTISMSKKDTDNVRIFSWGRNSHGQLGVGNEISVSSPVEVHGLESFKVSKIAAGGLVSAVVTEEGILFTWGQGKDYNLGHGSGNNISYPSSVDHFVGNGIGVASVSVSVAHSAVVSSLGKLYVWGNGYNGRLGFGDQKNKNLPEALQTSDPVQFVSCGKDFTAYITDKNEAFFSGGVRKGRPGVTQESFLNHPVQIELFDLKKNKQAVQTLSCGDSHIILLAKTGDVFGLGNNEFGQLGTGKVEAGMKYEAVPIFALRGKNIVQVSCGSFHSAAVTESGELYTWGRGAHGQLGHGTTADQSHPTLVEAFKNKKVVKVSCGSNHTAAITEDGTLYTFGKGVDGQLGHGNIGNRNVPLPVTSLGKFRVLDVVCGYDHTMVVAK